MSQQLVKKGANGRHDKVMPKSWIEAIKDKNTGQTLVEILQGFNMYFLPYNGNTSATRCLVPTMLRKKGLWITYVKYDGNVYTEWYAADEIDDKSWGDSSNWRISNNTLVGDITISANGNWVINGTETEFKAVGEKGNTPLIRVANNRLQVSYDLGDTYKDVTNNPVYTKFRWLATSGDTHANNVGRIQASTDEGKTWTNMSNDFTNNLHIKKYIGVNESLPTSGIAEGTIYAKGPYYAEDDTLNDNPIYRLWVYAWKGNTLAWQDNGEFQSIVAGVVQDTGDSETEVMSQKAVTKKLSELGSEVQPLNTIAEELHTSVLLDNQYINNNGSVTSITGFAVTNAITLNKGESIFALVAMYSSACVFAKSQKADGSGTKTPLLSGNGISNVQWYRYTAVEDNTYIVIGYQKEKGVEAVKSSSSTLKLVFSDLDAVAQSERRLELDSVDGVTSKVAAAEGTNYRNAIRIRFAAKDIIFAKVDAPTDVFNGSTISVYSDDDTWMASLPFNEWTELTIPKDTNSIYIGTNKVNVIGNGDVTFRIYDPSVTNALLGNYALKRGIFSEKGIFTPVENRQTTGLIRNISPMVLKMGHDLTSVNIVYGDSISSLVSGGYIINRGVNREAVIDVAAKYIAVNFVRENNYAENEWERFILTPQHSQTWEVNTKIDDLIDDNLLSAHKSIPMYQGLIAPSSGNIIDNDTRITTGRLPYNGRPLQITIAKGFNVACLYGYEAPYTDLSYVLRDGGDFILDVEAKVFGINITRADGKPIVPSDNVGLIVTEVKSPIANIVTNVKNPLDKLIEREIMNQFTQATTISDVNNVIAISDGFDINDKGMLCAGCIGSSDSPEEHDYPLYTAYLLMANLADIEGTKRSIKICEPSKRIDGIGTIENVSNAIAKWISDNEIAITFRGVFRKSDGVTQVYGSVGVVYNISTEEFGEFVYSTIKVGDVTYPMHSLKKPNADGKYEYDAESIANIESIWQNTDIEHHVGYSGVNTYEYYLGQNPKNINGVFYVSISLGNQSHSLCKSNDLINWEFVCDIPFNQASEEVAVCYYKNRIYATSRGNYDVDKQNSKVMYCPFDSLFNESWSTPIILNNCRNERPTIVGLNDRIYIMQGHGNVSVYTEGVKITRAEKELLVLDLELNILKSHVMQFTFPMLHPQFLSFGGNLWSVLSTDKRCYAFTASGDTRSEIGITHLDEYLFNLPH